MTRNLAFVVSRAYKECKLRSILLKCARAVHAARLGTFCRPFGLTPCIVANQHLSRNFCLRDTSAQGNVPDPPSSGSSYAPDNIMYMAPFISILLHIILLHGDEC